MTEMIFVNLPVRSLEASVEFFTKVGYTFNPQFTDETTTCMVVSDHIFFMLHEHAKFEQFAPGRSIADTSTSVEALFALSASERSDVDTVVDAAIAAGGTEFRPADDHGFMYGRSYADLDGHVWEHTWMDLSQMPTE